MNRKVKGEHINFAEPLRQRNWEIYRQLKSGGRTAASLGREHGVSATRIRQIIARGDRMVKHRAALGMEPVH